MLEIPRDRKDVCQCSEDRMNVKSKTTDTRRRYLRRYDLWTVYRRRICMSCGGRFSTYELDENNLTFNQKNEGD